MCNIIISSLFPKQPYKEKWREKVLQRIFDAHCIELLNRKNVNRVTIKTGKNTINGCVGMAIQHYFLWKLSRKRQQKPINNKYRRDSKLRMKTTNAMKIRLVNRVNKGNSINSIKHNGWHLYNVVNWRENNFWNVQSYGKNTSLVTVHNKMFQKLIKLLF